MRSLIARGSFDSLIFYQDLTLDPEDYFFILVWVVGVDVGVGGGLFLSLNLLIIIWHKVYVSVYIYTKEVVA